MNTQSIIQSFAPDIIIARRKGVMVRLFNTRTAKMGGWVKDPVAERQRTVTTVQRVPKLTILALNRLRVADLRDWADRYYELPLGRSSFRKADYVAYILKAQAASPEVWR